jgi:hypothetical protein
MFVVDFDEENVWELLEICHERASNGVKRSVRLATPREINMRNSVSILQPGITGKTIQNQCQALITFYIAGSLEVFIQNSANDII